MLPSVLSEDHIRSRIMGGTAGLGDETRFPLQGVSVDKQTGGRDDHSVQTFQHRLRVLAVEIQGTLGKITQAFISGHRE